MSWKQSYRYKHEKYHSQKVGKNNTETTIRTTGYKQILLYEGCEDLRALKPVMQEKLQSTYSYETSTHHGSQLNDDRIPYMKNRQVPAFARNVLHLFPKDKKPMLRSVYVIELEDKYGIPGPTIEFDTVAQKFHDVGKNNLVWYYSPYQGRTKMFIQCDFAHVRQSRCRSGCIFTDWRFCMSLVSSPEILENFLWSLSIDICTAKISGSVRRGKLKKPILTGLRK